jgi:hypothetical protein
MSLTIQPFGRVLFFTLPTFLLTSKAAIFVGGKVAQQVDGRLLCLTQTHPYLWP